MTLCTEYLKKHQINIPVIVHSRTNKHLILEESSYKWSLLSISWIDLKPYSVGHYNIKKLIPIHNSHDRRNNFQEVLSDDVQWEDFEKYLLKYRNKSVRNLEITLWFVFLYCFDQWIKDFGSKVLRHHIQDSISTMSYETTYNYLLTEHRGVAAIFDENFLCYKRSWCPFLSEFIGETEKASKNA